VNIEIIGLEGFLGSCHSVIVILWQ